MTVNGIAPRGARPARIRDNPASFLHRLDAHDELFGTFVKSPDANIVEVLIRAGYDFLVADLDHATLTLPEVATIVRTADLEAIPVIVRVTPGSLDLVGRILDVGAAGIQVTDVGSAEIGGAGRAAVEYPPWGSRGLAFSHRAASFGFESSEAYVQRSRRSVALIAQIESRDGVDALPDLVLSDDFDAFFLGPADLAGSLGHPGDADHASVRKALEDAAEMILAHGRVLGVFARDAADASAWRRRGATLIATGSDLTLIARAAREDVGRFTAAAAFSDSSRAARPPDTRAARQTNTQHSSPAPLPTSNGAGPSGRARDLVRGGYDLHVHVAPDIIPRRIDDVGLARRFAEVGLAGFVLKSHYSPTAERASVVRGVVPDVDVLGAIVLNSTVGGLNPGAVEVAARSAARVVWMPTFDAVNENPGRIPPAPDDRLPVWAQLQHEFRAEGVPTPEVPVLDADGSPRPELLAVLRVIARHRLVLATGHLSRDEIFAVVKTAAELGIADLIVTHPEFPSQRLSVVDQLELVSYGALLERCLTPSLAGRVSFERLILATRETGARNTFLSSDLGQAVHPPVEDGLALFADRFLAAGFSEEDVHTMTVVNTRRLALGRTPAFAGSATSEKEFQ